MMLDRTQQPEISDFKSVQMVFPEERRLDNGIKLLVINRGDQEVNRLDFLFEGGAYEQSQPMVSSAMVSMLRQGGVGYDAQAIAEKFDFCGAWVQGRSHDHNTSVTIYSINRCFDQIMPVIEAIIKTPTFPAHEFEVIKKQLIGNLKNSKEQVRYLALQGFNKIYFGDEHPFGKNVTVDALKSLTHDMLIDFHNTFYRPENCTMILSGIVTDEIINSIESHFGGKWGVDGSKSEIKTTPLCHSELKSSVVDKPNSVQAGVVIGVDAVNRSHPDYIPLRILVTAFGGYFGSRLMTNIREDKGYTYGISAGLIGRKECSYILISSECDTKYTQLLIDEVKGEMQKLIDNPIDEDELSIVKSNMLSDLVKTVDSPFAIAEYNITSLCYGISNEYFEQQVEVIQNITAEELQVMAKKYFVEENIYISIAGDKNKL